MLIERYFPYVAGAERQVQARIPAVARHGLSTMVITRHQPGLSRRAIVDGAPVYRIAAAAGRLSGSLRFTLSALLLIARHQRQVDLVHAYDLFSPTTTGLLAKLLFGKPVVAEVLGGGSFGDLAVLRRLRSGRIRIWLMRRFVDAFVALSQEIELDLRGLGVPAERIVRLSNGVDTDLFCPPDPARRAHVRTQLELNEPTVVYVGRLHVEKGLDVLLDAWPKVLQHVCDAKLLLVGDGPLRDVLEARRSARVQFVGTVNNPVPYLQAADCFVLPSRSEGQPVALIEAMSTGLPCVATAIGGTVDVVTDDVDGWLVPPDDSDGLARGIVRALTAADRHDVGAAARRRTVSDFALHMTAERLARLYRELLARATA